MKKHIAAVLTAGALWGLMGLFTRSLAQFGISSTGAILLRCGVAALCFGITQGHLVFHRQRNLQSALLHLLLL